MILYQYPVPFHHRFGDRRLRPANDTNPQTGFRRLLTKPPKRRPMANAVGPVNAWVSLSRNGRQSGRVELLAAQRGQDPICRYSSPAIMPGGLFAGLRGLSLNSATLYSAMLVQLPPLALPYLSRALLALRALAHRWDWVAQRNASLVHRRISTMSIHSIDFVNQLDRGILWAG